MSAPGDDRGRPRQGGLEVEQNDTTIVPTTSTNAEFIDVVNAELVEVMRRAGVLLVSLADRLEAGRADLPLAVEQVAELLRDMLVVVARSTGAVDR